MKYSLSMLSVLLAVHVCNQAIAQEATFRVLHQMELPPGLLESHGAGCSLEFQEEWIIDPAGSTIGKSVESYSIPCGDSSVQVGMGEGTISLKDIRYEFSFLDLPEDRAGQVQLAFTALIQKRSPLPGSYDPSEQLLSVYFHEDWTIGPGQGSFTKKVRGITPVIWQRRQTADGESLPDPETGYPVYYKHTLGRIDLRRP